MELKQVIILRKDLNMRKGKMVAQGSHASLKSFHHAMVAAGKDENSVPVQWFNGLSKKICVGVDSEQELLMAHAAAEAASLPCALIKDAGLTEFKEETYTAVAIGPALSSDIDRITGGFKLL